jgi:hypothetical protein
MQEEDYECKRFVADRAERIVQELTKTARALFHRGYGTTNLIFSDCSFVSLTDSGVISEVAALLRASSQPLGCCPAPQAILPKQQGHGDMENAARFPHPHPPDDYGQISNEALH